MPETEMPSEGLGQARSDIPLIPAEPTISEADSPTAPKQPKPRSRRQSLDAAHNGGAAGESSDGQYPYGTHSQSAVASDDQLGSDTHVFAVIAQIRDLHRIRRAHMLAAGDMERRIKALERWAARARILQTTGKAWDKPTFPPVHAADRALVLNLYPSFHEAAAVLRQAQKVTEKPLVKLVRKLPVYSWVKAQKGLGDLSLATIVGEAGDIGSYGNPGKLWKRMGLAVFDGKSQRRTTNAEDALRQGYSPLRRSMMFVIGDCLIKAGGPLKALYDERKAAYSERDGMTKMHAHRMAQRYIEKRLLRELWKAWRAATARLMPLSAMSPVEISGQGGNETSVPNVGGGGHRPADTHFGCALAKLSGAAE